MPPPLHERRVRPPRTVACIALATASAAAFGCSPPPAPTDAPTPAIAFEWVNPDLGLLDVTTDAVAARLVVETPGADAFDVPAHPDAPTRIMLPALADPTARAATRLTVRAGATHAGAAIPEPPPRRFPPDWSLGAVWYQAFPDRFWNADPTNDPDTTATFVPEWNAPWSEVTVEELERARAADLEEGRRANPRATPFRQVVYRRRYAGDLQGLVERLPHIADLGATAIYLNPVFDAPSLHRYDASDHRHVDPTLGLPGDPPDTETADPATWARTPADGYLLDSVLPAVHDRGLHLVLDGVWNHVGLDHWAFRDVLARGRASPYASWFRVRFGADVGDPALPPDDVVAWTAWDGPNGRLPEFGQTPDGDLVPSAKAHVAEVTRWWMNAADRTRAIDGWRLDVVPDIGLPFWRDWNALVHATNPDAITIAEVWYRADDALTTGGFDAQMNYPVRDALLPWLAGAGDAATLVARLERALAPGDRVNLVQMNLLGSHDTPRVATRIADLRGSADPRRPDREARELVVLGVATLVALPGAPSIYNGDEWGVAGADDPDNRKPVPWPDAGPYADADAPLPWVRDQVAAWLRLRTDPDLGPILRYGSWRLVAPEDDVVGVERSLNGRRVLFLANRSDHTVDLGKLLDDTMPVPGAPGSPGSALPPRAAAIRILK